jgi:hypothetical protein
LVILWELYFDLFCLEHFMGNINDQRPIRRSRSISQSFKNLFRSNSKKKNSAAKADALGEFENGKIRYFVIFC